jgi:hypothetical protein
MSGSNELQTTRLDGEIDAGSDIVVAFQTLEASLRNILGADADSVLSAIMAMATGPNVTFQGEVTLAGAPTADLHCATRAYVGTKIAPMFTRYYCGRHTQSVAPTTEAPTVGVDWSNLGDHKDSAWVTYGNGRLVPPEEGVYVSIISATLAGTSTGKFQLYGHDGTNMILSWHNLSNGGRRSAHLVMMYSIVTPSSAPDSCITSYMANGVGSTSDVDISAVVLRVAGTT